YLQANLQVLARGGRMVVIGLQGGTKAELDLGVLLAKGAAIAASTLRSRPAEEKTAIVSQAARLIWPLVSSGSVPLPPITRFGLSQAAAAHQHLESGENVGKIVLVPGS
ncbi:MAG: zinc-binding dehydrogenase, partial [Micrococcales bacterium]|nr:zinc-binding dehydrogenase [Micrococcales bacterium]